MMNNLLDIKIPDYEGPLDLLVYLVHKNEMNIFNIPISQIAIQFIDELKKMREMDIEIASEFIYMATLLIYLKSRQLLPKEVLAEDDIDPEEAEFRLKQTIIDRAFYKFASSEFGKMEQRASKCLARTENIVLLKEERVLEDPFKLASAFFMLSKRDKKDKVLIVNNDAKVERDKVAKRIKNYLLSRDKTLWSEVLSQCSEKIDSCISFSIILELAKNAKISVYQENNFAEILMTLLQTIKEDGEKKVVVLGSN